MYSRPLRPQSPPFPLEAPPPATSPPPPPSHPASLLISRPSSTIPARNPSPLNLAPQPRDPSIGAAPHVLEQGDRDGNEALAEVKADGGPEAMLTLVLYSHHGRMPWMRRVVVSETRGAAREVSGGDRQAHATSRDFDDEKLFKLIRAEYGRMRGVFWGLLSARHVRDLGFLSYTRASQLAKQHKRAQRKMFPVKAENGFVETKLLNLYRKPRIGRGKHEWVEWISRLPENSGGQDTTKGKFALELVEGWWVEKIGLAVLAAVVLTLLATLLWVFLGVGSNHGDLNFSCRPRRCHDGFRGAGGRVETGAVLGALVLMLGWTGVGAWVFLSWLA